MAADGTRIAVTGHRNLVDRPAVMAAVKELLGTLSAPLVCVSALAMGADQLVARAVLDAGGALDVIVPADDYQRSLPACARATFDELSESAASVTRLPHRRSGAAAYADAGRRILESADLLLAVWDGGPSRGEGGTADVVRMAHDRGIPVHVIAAQRAAE